MYTNWKVNDIISMGVKVEDFCGTVSSFLWMNSYDMQLYPNLINISCNRPNCSYNCLDTRGREVVFYSCMNYHRYTNDVNCSNRSVDKYYRELSRIRSDGRGISSFNHLISLNDLADYNDAVSNGGTYNIVACLNDSESYGAHAVNFGSISVTEYVPVTPTHYISLGMGFVPAELINYFETYITEISNRIMTYLSPLPSPWQYVETTYDRVSNSFKIWVYNPAALGITEDLQGLWNWLSYWVPVILGVVLIIIGIVAAAGFIASIPLWLAFLSASGGLAILIWKLYDARTLIIKAEEKAKNSDIRNQQTDKENKLNQENEDKWNASNKEFNDCLTRLEGRKEIHNGIITGYISQYAKYALFVDKMKVENDTYLRSVGDIINAFKVNPYSVDICNSYFINMINAGNSSNIRIAELISQYINIDDPYVPPSDGYGNKIDCEAAGYVWYDNKCHETGACWIQGPLDTCILSASAGKGILTVGGLLAGGYILLKYVSPKKG